jgi:hypothetical protein
VRQVALAAALGAVVGAVTWMTMAGQVASSRASPVPWIAAGVVTGTLAVGVALLGAGVRLSTRGAAFVRALIVGWWALDAWRRTTTSPMSVLGHLAFGPTSPVAIVSVAAGALGVAGLGVLRIGSLSIEKAWRRSGAADQLRVAVGLNDLRTALLIVRRRSDDSPRLRPWRAVAGRWTARQPVVARSVRALVRWPLRRIVRFVALAGAAGAVVVGSPDRPVLGGVAALLVYMGALDALAQELDHPDLRRGFPISDAALATRHLVVPLGLMTGFAIVASLAAGIVGGGWPAVGVGLASSPSIAIAAVAGAALTAVRTARPFTRVTDIGLPPEVVVPRIVLRVVAPVLPLAATIIPMASAGPTARAVWAGVPGGLVSVGVLAVVLGGRAWIERKVALLLAS